MTAGGSVAGGSVAGGSVAGGSVAGGSVAGGSAAGGSVAGGSVAGGSVAGGSVAGGSVAGGSVAGGSVAGGSVAGGSADAGTGNLQIFVVGSLTPKTFTDGLAGQTPTQQQFGVGRFDLMISPTDPAPVTAFDHGSMPVQVDMLSVTPTLAGVASSTSVPAGTYGWGRVQLTSLITTVNATIHLSGNAVPGTLTITSALSDTMLEGTAWPKGRTRYTFTALVGPGPVSFFGPPPPLLSGGGGIVEEAGKTFMIFQFTTPYVIDPRSSAARTATIVYDVYHSFRWLDGAQTGFAPNVFDVDGATMTSEQVRNFGATGFRTIP